jgi:integrase
MRPTNPCARTRLPEIPGREMHFLTHAEFGRLYEATPERYRPLVLLLVLTGLRWGEATGLYARHLSLTTNPATLRVVQSYQRTDKGQFEIGPPKTKAARRTLSLPANLVAELLPLWQARNGGAFLFTSSQGTPVRHSNFYNRVWKPTVKRAGLPDDLRIHDLRHSYASWLIAGGRPLPSIQRRLGHESITTTIDRYGHLLPEVDLGDLTVLEEAFALPATVSATPAAA